MKLEARIGAVTGREKMKTAFAWSAAALVAIGLQGCTPDYAKQDAADVILEIAGVNGTTGPIQSSVSNLVSDDVIVNVNVFQKNPDLASSSPNGHLYVDRYDVQYFRSDGHNVEGVDVPYRFSGSVGNIRFHTPSSGTEVEIDFPITLVRLQAKLEPPLRNLFGALPSAPSSVESPILNGAGVLTVLGQLTIYGTQLNGATTKATATFQVTFTN